MPDHPIISIVIPVWRDEEALAQSLRRVRASSDAEVIVACVFGEERRYQEHREGHPTVRWISAPRGRAAQMNAGASIAAGRWLLFLHADSELPPDWLDVLTEADRRGDIVGGAFRLAIDSGAWQARVIERAVRLRVALFGLPYGDQALFVRRAVFDEIGGYDDLPLMEDVDLVRRLKSTGPMTYVPSPVSTSARRWERDGWFRRSGQNLSLAARFLFGASPARLAQAYFRRRSSAIVIMARAPWTRGKTRLGVVADETAHIELRRALFLDTLDAVRAVSGVAHIVACEPAEACEGMRELAGQSIDVMAQRGEDLGQRMTRAIEDTFRLGYESVVVVGSDLPDLPPRLLDAAIARLRSRDTDIVLGPSADGGYYLIGMNRLWPAVFEPIEWSTGRVLAQTLEAAAAQGLSVALLDPWADVDDPGDLDRFLTRSNGLTASHTRAWAMSALPAGRTLTPPPNAWPRRHGDESPRR